MTPSFSEATCIPLGQKLILEALTYYQSRYPDPTSLALEPPLPFPDTLLINLFDLLMATDEYAKAVFEIKRGVRWLQGRIEEREWEKVKDDREFDVPGFVRDGSDQQGAGRELNINLRHRLGLARLQLGHIHEARVSPV